MDIRKASKSCTHLISLFTALSSSALAADLKPEQILVPEYLENYRYHRSANRWL